MKANKLTIITLFALSIVACSKESVNNSASINASATDNLAVSPCDKFAYPDTIFYPQVSLTDYKIKPVTAQTGTYGAFPDGLKINKSSGLIDINESETGLKYIVWFLATGSKDTCKKFIIISGVNYVDSIFTMNGMPAVSTPVYNATTKEKVDCAGGCEFDDGHDDDNGNGFADEPPAGEEVIPQGVVMNKSTGVIDFKRSFQNGALGKSPKNGTFKDFILNYRIGDPSAKALNTIGFRMYYYKYKSQIPDSLINIINAKKSLVIEDDDKVDDDRDLTKGGSITNLTAKHGQGEVKCRPPYIIVTQQ